jgi:8-oxo-dGTP pyrophosphatase MutT (NUDIX family)
VADAQDLQQLRRHLGGSSAGEARAGRTPAAVLVPFLPGPDGWYLLLTRRTDVLPNHRGEVAFPGGRLEPGETTLQAALREAHEELGIEPLEVDVLGPLPVVETNHSLFAITPWVGVVLAGRRERLEPNPGEVAEVIELPLAMLAAPGSRRDQRFIRGPHLVASPAYDVGTTTVWGATARIVSELLEAIR